MVKTYADPPFAAINCAIAVIFVLARMLSNNAMPFAIFANAVRVDDTDVVHGKIFTFKTIQFLAINLNSFSDKSE
jgi:hypothetical protein